MPHLKYHYYLLHLTAVYSLWRKEYNVFVSLKPTHYADTEAHMVVLPMMSLYNFTDFFHIEYNISCIKKMPDFSFSFHLLPTVSVLGTSGLLGSFLLMICFGKWRALLMATKVLRPPLMIKIHHSKVFLHNFNDTRERKFIKF